MWWCPTGPLSALPLHAAGVYDDTSGMHADTNLSSIAISSYIPTLSSLLNSRKPRSNEGLKILVVAQSKAPGLPTISGTETEIRGIMDIAKSIDSPISITAILGREATKQHVFANINSCQWAHFACHGLQNREPHKSALYLGDGPLGLLEITEKQLLHAEFAFLSACQTATGDAKISEEAIHISAGMLLAGYQGVVGTMWSIPDSNTPELVQEFYTRILANGKHDPKAAARCLSEAVRAMRGKMKLEHWVPFIHLGI
jgi:CHAT domain-containing protein